MQKLDVLRDDREDGDAEEAFHVFHRLHAGIEILDEEGQAEPDDQTNQGAERKIQADAWTRGITRRLRDLLHADGHARHRQLHRLRLGARSDAIEQHLLLDVKVLGARVGGAEVLGSELPLIDLLKAFRQFVTRGSARSAGSSTRRCGYS